MEATSQKVGQESTAKPNGAVAVVQPVQVPAPSTPMELLSNALSMGADINVLEKLMALQERHEATQARRAFDAAISAAKAEIPVINKNRKVGYDSKKGGGSTNYDHEDLGEIARTVDPILSRHGLSYRFRTAQNGPQITVTCVIAHRGGHFEETSLSSNPDASGSKNPIQAMGSAITYLQRYLLKAALGLASSKDDDGKAAGIVEGLITADQIAELKDLIAEVGTTEEAFLKRGKVESFDGIAANQFEAAKALLLRKKGVQQ